MSLRLSSLTVLVALAAAGTSDSAGAQAARPRNPLFHSNREKYSDAGAKPASGRSGTASLESRVLIGKDGSAVLEASTGSLENGTAPGSIRKMQVKIFAMNNVSSDVLNFNGLSGAGYWSTPLQGLGRNQKIQLQANVGGIDGNRTDVVTVLAQAKRRPDVTVSALTMPSRAMARTRVNVVATVAEKNGDVGARATCVLTVDGRAMDQATGIWVDAGQSVSCAFQTSIDAVGAHQVSVYVTGVSPMDWDASNNTANGAIEIVSPESRLSYSVDFDANDYDYAMHYKYTSGDGTYRDEKTETGKRQNRSMTMSAYTSAEAFAFPVKVHTSLSAGSGSVFDLTKDIAIAPDESWDGGDCGSSWEGGFYLNVCNYHSDGFVMSQVDVSSYDGRVTYVGTRYYQADGYEGYIQNSGGDTSNGYGAYAVGSTVMPVVELSDSRGKLFAARPTIQLQSSPIESAWNSCYLDARRDVTYCNDGMTKGTSKAGTASSTTP